MWISDTIEVNGDSFFYTRTGGDRPPIVMAHGGTGCNLDWLPVAQALEADYDLIMLDARGHGKSVRATPGEPYNLVADLAGAIDAFGLDRPIVMGQSLGAVTATGLAARYPEKTCAIILEDPALVEKFEPGWHHVYRQANQDRQKLSSGELLANIRKKTVNWTEENRLARVQGAIQVDPDLFLFDPLAGLQSTNVYPYIKCPGLLITSDPEMDVLMTPEEAQEIITMWPQGQWMHIPDAGHVIHCNQFERYMEVVREFLRTLQ